MKINRSFAYYAPTRVRPPIAAAASFLRAAAAGRAFLFPCRRPVAAGKTHAYIIKVKESRVRLRKYSRLGCQAWQNGRSIWQV